MEKANQDPFRWFVLRDLKRPNAKLPAYKQLTEAGFTVFTPMTSKVVLSRGKKIRVEVPYVPDLLFVHSDRQTLDPVIDRTETLQYRFLKGAPYRTPMTVPTDDMNRFMAAVTQVETPTYYSPTEITPDMYGAMVRIVCDGPLNGFEGKLLKVKGSRKKRFLVELPGLLAASIEISKSDYLQLLP